MTVMKIFLIGLSIILLVTGGYVFAAGWQNYHSESALMARQIGNRLNISRPFWSQPGVSEMAIGSSALVAGVVLVVSISGGPPRTGS